MRSLLNITVLVSSVLSIFSTTLALYDEPDIRSRISVFENGEKIQGNSSTKDLKRIYISHDVSKTQDIPTLLATYNSNPSMHSNNHINIFGVKVPTKNTNKRI